MQKISLVFLISLATVLISACALTSNNTASAEPSLSPEVSPTPGSTNTPVIEYVAAVNGEGITRASYEVSLTNLLAAQAQLGTNLATEEASQRVLDDLVNRLLLAQSARAAGFVITDELVNQRLDAVTQQAGGQEAFVAWMQTYGYTPELFRAGLELEIEAAWMRDQIIAGVPERAEQVRARQVLLYTRFDADRLYNQLESGVPFDQIVANNDPRNLGYLDWFPRGYLLQPELEAAAFSLQPGEYSPVIETAIGFHILQVLEVDPDRPLSADARLTLQMSAVHAWLEQQRSQSQIEIYGQ